MKLIGYVVGWNQGPASNMLMDGFTDSRAPISIDMHIFPKREHAEIVLAAEKLKQPGLDWSIFEVHGR